MLSSATASISELKINPAHVIKQAHQEEAVAILNRNKPMAYLLSPELYEKLLDALDELELREILKKRLKDEHKAIEVSLDDL